MYLYQIYCIRFELHENINESFRFYTYMIRKSDLVNVHLLNMSQKYLIKII